ncbi:MAG: homoserine kinase [Alphaproteobacteria bacterium]|nr:homoserine kinase [Alphaproteobacteria bacterium]MDP6517757.1 homoserine kinase [Alphaproteobacteria bacterium]
MAVYTHISDADLKAFVADYDIGEVSSLIAIAEGIENSNYLLLCEGGRYILTIYERRVRHQDLPFFLSLMEHLSGRGIACPTPVRAHDGDALSQIAGKPAAIVTFLAGVWPRRIWPNHCRELGAALAGLHLAAMDFDGTRANDLSVGSWSQMFERVAAQADTIKLGLEVELRAELMTLEQSWPRGLPSGIIHADLFPDNVFFEGDKLSGLIDFYFACTDFFAYDIAVCLNAWCFEPDGAFNITKARNMLASYRSARPFSADELRSLPLLCRGAAMRFLLTRLHDWLNTPEGALVRPKDPLEYFHKLRFHQSVDGPGAYGLD